MNNDNFLEFMKSISINYIQPISISFERFGNLPKETIDVRINWKMSYPEEPITIKDNNFSIPPMFEINFIYNNTIVYSHKSIFVVMISIKNQKIFEKLWSIETIQKTFKEKQIRNTLWPIVRQQVLDGLSRLSLPPISLPWIM